MWRHYAVAALIVVALGSVLLAKRIALRDVKLRGDAVATPPPVRGNSNAGYETAPEPFFDGEGGWVLSALPACFTQLSSIAGPSQALVFHVPPDRERIAPGKRIASGNCALVVRPHDVWVYRGKDRLRVPPEARLFATKAGLTLVYERAGRTEVRVYGAVTR